MKNGGESVVVVEVVGNIDLRMRHSQVASTGEEGRVERETRNTEQKNRN